MNKNYLFILILIIILSFIYYYEKIDYNIRLDCNINSSNDIIVGNGFFIIKDILDEKCRQNIVNLYLDEARNNKNLNEVKNFEFYSNSNFLQSLSKLIGQKLYPVNSLDLQRCWLRYYFEGMKSQYYEIYHHDKKRYNSSIKQFRLVIPVYDTSDSKFSIDGYGEFSFKQNMGVVLEAGNCLHKVNFTSGERLLLIMDFINKDCDSLYSHYECRGVYGICNWIIDIIWRHLSSINYKLMN